MDVDMEERIVEQLSLRKEKLWCVHDSGRACEECMKNIRGDVSGITGDVSGITGDVSGIRGYVSDIKKILQEDIFMAERRIRVTFYNRYGEKKSFLARRK